MRRIDRVVVAAVLVACGLAVMGAAAQPAAGTDQSGEKNFAGPASMCPGDDWNCVGPESFPVAQAGEENVIVCTGSDTAACAGSTQEGDSNKIECVNEQNGVSSLVQACGPFTQEGDDDARNEALFKLTFETTVGSTQCALQTGEIVQEGGTNQFKASFKIVQETKSGLTQIQEAHQVVLADQFDAVEKNQSDVDQVQVQKASGNATKQLQNTGDSACAGHFPVPEDCADSGLAGPEEPYACMNLSQDLDEDGENISKLFQDVKQEAESNASGAEQQQGTPDGGNDGRVHQSADFGDGKNVDVVDQKTEQKLVASGADQSQFEDPHCCGVDSQDGGEDNEETINQTVKQEAGPNALQEASAIGVGVSPDGECKVNQSVENGTDSAQVSESQEPCEILAVNTTCVSGEEGGCETTTDPDAACRDGFVLVSGEGGLVCEPELE